MLELISRDFWWFQMWKAVKEFVLSCDTHSKSKNPRHCPYVLLQPLLIPRQPWSFVSIDFITNLPSLRNFDAMFIIIDRLTKMAHFVSCKKIISREETARFFVNNDYWYHGLSYDSISDRTTICLQFWISLFEILKVDIKLSSAFHLQTDSQTEHVMIYILAATTTILYTDMPRYKPKPVITNVVIIHSDSNLLMIKATFID